MQHLGQLHSCPFYFLVMISLPTVEMFRVQKHLWWPLCVWHCQTYNPAADLVLPEATPKKSEVASKKRKHQDAHTTPLAENVEATEEQDNEKSKKKKKKSKDTEEAAAVDADGGEKKKKKKDANAEGEKKKRKKSDEQDAPMEIDVSSKKEKKKKKKRAEEWAAGRENGHACDVLSSWIFGSLRFRDLLFCKRMDYHVRIGEICPQCPISCSLQRNG